MTHREALGNRPNCQAIDTKLIKDCEKVSVELLELITITLLFTLTFCSLNANFLVVLLQSCQVLTCLRELTFFHTFTDVPMHKSSLGIHEIELVINSREHLCNGR